MVIGSFPPVEGDGEEPQDEVDVQWLGKASLSLEGVEESWSSILSLFTPPNKVPIEETPLFSPPLILFGVSQSGR